jgi:hypothetical protein
MVGHVAFSPVELDSGSGGLMGVGLAGGGLVKYAPEFAAAFGQR